MTNKSMDLNKVQLIGRLTRDPEIRTTPTGQNVASFSVATGYSWTDQSGQKKEQTEFHNLVAWRKLADIIGQYLKKGSQVYLEGRLTTRSWDDQKSGTKKYRTEIVVDNMIMLGSKPNNGTQSQPVAQTQPAMAEGEIRIDDSDIPF